MQGYILHRYLGYQLPRTYGQGRYLGDEATRFHAVGGTNIDLSLPFLNITFNTPEDTQQAQKDAYSMPYDYTGVPLILDRETEKFLRRATDISLEKILILDAEMDDVAMGWSAHIKEDGRLTQTLLRHKGHSQDVKIALVPPSVIKAIAAYKSDYHCACINNHFRFKGSCQFFMDTQAVAFVSSWGHLYDHTTGSPLLSPAEKTVHHFIDTQTNANNMVLHGAGRHSKSYLKNRLMRGCAQPTGFENRLLFQARDYDSIKKRYDRGFGMNIVPFTPPFRFINGGKPKIALRLP